MGSERQCGLGSLVPMSCRGRAEAFARRLHTRLRRLGVDSTGGPECTPNRTESDDFFDFEVEPESPQSPIETNYPLSPPEQVSPPSNSDSDGTYYDLDTDSEPKVSNFLKIQRQNDENQTNKIKLHTSSASDLIDHLFQNRSNSPDRQSPIRTQPLAKDNAFTDYGSIDRNYNSNFAAINFGDCQRRNSTDKYNDEEEGTSLNDSVVEDISSEDTSQNTIVDQSDDSILNCPIEDLKLDIAEVSEVSDEVNEINIEEATPDEEEREISVEPEENVLDESKLSPSTDTDDSDDRPQRVRRCSSLKTGKTPPGTPGRKKIVRFADVLGLDLADVKTFMDDVPQIPKSAFEDLRDAEPLSSSPIECFMLNDIVRTDRTLVRNFQQPGDLPNFLDLLNCKNVCLESACVQEGATIAIRGLVRVRNLDFHKSVHIRYSLDGWKTFSDLQATYVPNSCDGFSDRFQFLQYAHTLQVGQTLEFAIRFMCKGCQYWDSNDGYNYCFKCIARNTQPETQSYAPPLMNSIDNWNASFY